MKSAYVSLWYTQFRKLRALKGSDLLLCNDTEFDLHLVILNTLHWQLPFHSTLVTILINKSWETRLPKRLKCTIVVCSRNHAYVDIELWLISCRHSPFVLSRRKVDIRRLLVNICTRCLCNFNTEVLKNKPRGGKYRLIHRVPRFSSHAFWSRDRLKLFRLFQWRSHNLQLEGLLKTMCWLVVFNVTSTADERYDRCHAWNSERSPFRITWFHIFCKELFIVLGVHWLDFNILLMLSV